jgi:hypothetical protein
VVADVLSHKYRCNHITVQSPSTCCDPKESSLRGVPHGRLNNIALISTIKEDIIAAQRTDVVMGHLHQRMESGEAQCFRQDADGVLWLKDRLVVLKDFELHCKIMDEAHCSWYSIHPGTNKMYQDLRKNFWWTRMKREIAKYVSECDTCHRIKADHLRPAGNLQPLSIPEWKWENICMYFIVGLPRTSHGYNSIWVIVDCFTKSAHFISVSMTYRVGQYAELYISHMSPFEALYRRPCRTPLSWSESDERVIFGPDIVTEAEEKVKGLPLGLPNERCMPLRYQRKTSTPLHWSVSYP